jgi:hypothetical protein
MDDHGKTRTPCLICKEICEPASHVGETWTILGEASDPDSKSSYVTMGSYNFTHEEYMTTDGIKINPTASRFSGSSLGRRISGARMILSQRVDRVVRFDDLWAAPGSFIGVRAGHDPKIVIGEQAPPDWRLKRRDHGVFRRLIDNTIDTLFPGPKESFRWRFEYRDVVRCSGMRSVEPVAVVNRLMDGSVYSYLLCWDLDVNDWRTFRTDRIVGKIQFGKSFDPSLRARPRTGFSKQLMDAHEKILEHAAWMSLEQHETVKRERQLPPETETLIECPRCRCASVRMETHLETCTRKDFDQTCAVISSEEWSSQVRSRLAPKEIFTDIMTLEETFGRTVDDPGMRPRFSYRK